MVMRLQMNENQMCQSQVHVTARQYLIFKPGKRGLNIRLRKNRKWVKETAWATVFRLKRQHIHANKYIYIYIYIYTYVLCI
jgi:hypothetical protein